MVSEVSGSGTCDWVYGFLFLAKYPLKCCSLKFGVDLSEPNKNPHCRSQYYHHIPNSTRQP